MYEVTIERDFHADHAITVAGEVEPTHGHDWHVTVVVSGEKLDEDGLLLDFHLLQERLDTILSSLRDRDLNRTGPFDRINPTAEHVARHLADTLTPALPGGVRLSRVDVTEAPGCTATYRPEEARRHEGT